MFTIVWDPVRAVEEAMREDGESQASLAKRLGWDPSKVSKILARDQELRVGELIQIMKVQDRSSDYYFTAPIIHDLSLADWFRRPIDFLAAA